MKRIFLFFLLWLLAGSAFASKQYYWSYGGSQLTASGKTCDALKEAVGKSSNYICITQSPGNTVTDLTGGNGVFLFVHPNYGVENNGPLQYVGPAPDKCDPPRYIGPDTSKPPGQQCERVACVAGDSAGRYGIPTAYVDAEGETLQIIQHVADVNWCIDGCFAKARTDDGGANMVCTYNPTSATGVRIATCESDFVDSNDKCTVPHDSDAPPTPYDPNTPPPTCGGAGQPACPPAGTCGGPGQPGCPPSTCGGVGQPACFPGGTCGGAGQPSCSNGDGSGPGGTTGGGTSGGGGPTCGVTGISGVQELVVVFGGDDSFRCSGNFFVENWSDIFVPSRDDAMVYSPESSFILFYCHENEFEVGQRVVFD